MSRSYKITLLCVLYLAQGLPYGFFTVALPALMRAGGMSLKAISALSLLYLPWALKFLWAPAVEGRGNRKQWLLALQCAGVVVAALMTLTDIERSYLPVLIAAFAFSTIAATQDVVTDGLAVRLLDTRERGIGNGIQVGAYRIGMILGSGLLLNILANTSWAIMSACMAVLLALTIVPVLALHEPERGVHARADAMQMSLGWIQRLAMPGMLGFIGLIFCYRFGDEMLSTLLIPFFVDQGLDLKAISVIKGTVGSASSLAGAVVGGWFAFCVRRRTLLLVSGLVQAACFGLYIAIALGNGGIRMLWMATIVEGVVSTMATVALFTLMMDASDPDHAGVDYTLFASAVVIFTFVSNLAGAVIADKVGYAPAFIAGAVLSALGCLALVWVLDRWAMPPRVAQAWNGPTRRLTTRRDEVTT